MGCAPCARRRAAAETARRQANAAAAAAPAPSGRVYELIDQHTGAVVTSGDWPTVKDAQREQGGMIRSSATSAGRGV